MIALVTDSNAQLPSLLIDRYDIQVVPLTVTVDGVDHLEGVDIEVDAFYDLFTRGTAGPPQVTTSQPSPGLFGEAYARAATRGAEAILSIHIGSEVSGTLNSARIAAARSEVPVRLVDTATASFATGCCVWEAAEALAAGADLESAASVAETLAPRIGNVFVVGGLELARAGGRLHAGAAEGVPDGGLPVLSLVEGSVRPVGHAADAAEAAAIMARTIQAGGDALRVAVGVADRGAGPTADALVDRLVDAPQVAEMIRYRIGPSVGVHTGPGTAGAVYYPPTRP